MWTNFKKGDKIAITSSLVQVMLASPGIVYADGNPIGHGSVIKAKGVIAKSLTATQDGLYFNRPSPQVDSAGPSLTNTEKMPGQLSAAEAFVTLGVREMRRERAKLAREMAEHRKEVSAKPNPQQKPVEDKKPSKSDDKQGDEPEPKPDPSEEKTEE